VCEREIERDRVKDREGGRAGGGGLGVGGKGVQMTKKGLGVGDADVGIPIFGGAKGKRVFAHLTLHTVHREGVFMLGLPPARILLRSFFSLLALFFP